MRLQFLLYSLIGLLFFTACNSDYTPRPRGYFKVPLPKHEYRLFDKPGYPYTFEYPVYANVIQDSTFFEEKPENPYWINIDFPQFSGCVYISYKEIGKQSFEKLVDDTYKMTFKHTVKATGINDSLIETPHGVSGIFFKVGGNAASGRQFFLTDTVKHFLRGALYFGATPNEDSLKEVGDFLEQDIRHLINTFKWR
ncbi:MAG TPA: hypothetical protein VD993_13440 [Chitinophagaceae bacterium]|nr:hypothetical protein [Chitinophagaceae bacterium]